MFFAIDAATAVGVPPMVFVRLALRRRLSGVHVQPVLALLREPDQERDEVVHDRVRHVLGQPFFLHTVLVQCSHEVGQRLRHPELQFKLAAGKYQWVLHKTIRHVHNGTFVSVTTTNAIKHTFIIALWQNFLKIHASSNAADQARIRGRRLLLPGEFLSKHKTFQ